MGRPGRNIKLASVSNEVETALYEVRKKIYPRAVHGWFAAWRWALVLATQLVFYGGAWLPWNDRQAVLFDIAHRKFYVFGLVFWPQDVIYLAVLLIISALALFLFTALAGRLWCGYACPQTVYTEIFLWIERKVEGDRNARMRLDQSRLSPRKFFLKGSKHGLWIAFSLWTGFTFVGYVTPIRELGAERIGHGVKAVEDPALMDFLAEHGIGIESCLTSNIQTSTVPSLAQHPLATFLRHGVLASINTDDPAVQGIEIEHEYRVAAPQAGQVHEQRGASDPEVRVGGPAVQDAGRVRVPVQHRRDRSRREPVDERPGPRLTQQALEPGDVSGLEAVGGEVEQLHGRHPQLVDPPSPQLVDEREQLGSPPLGGRAVHRKRRLADRRDGRAEERGVAFQVGPLRLGSFRGADRAQSCLELVGDDADAFPRRHAARSRVGRRLRARRPARPRPRAGGRGTAPPRGGRTGRPAPPRRCCSSCWC